MDVELDAIIQEEEKPKNEPTDVAMKEKGYGPRRRTRQFKHRDSPYQRHESRYSTSGDTENPWKHDLFDKDEEEIEQTGWGTRKRSKRNDNSFKLSIENLHYEVTTEELKVKYFY